MTEEELVEKVAREICTGCNLDPDAISPKTAAKGHTIQEWWFFTVAARAAIAAMREAGWVPVTHDPGTEQHKVVGVSVRTHGGGGGTGV